MAKYLWKIIWEIEKSDYFKTARKLDFHFNLILKEKFYPFTTTNVFFFTLFKPKLKSIQAHCEALIFD